MQLLQSMYMPILVLPFWVGFSFVDLLCKSSITRNHESADAPTQRGSHIELDNTTAVHWGGSILSGKHHVCISMLIQMWCLYIIISLRKNSCSLFLYVVLHYYTRRGTASQGLPNRLAPGCILAGILRFHACNAYSSKQQIHPLIIDGWHSATITSAWSSQDGEIGYVDTKWSILLSLAQTEHQTQIPFLNHAKLWLPFRVGRAPIVHSVK